MATDVVKFYQITKLVLNVKATRFLDRVGMYQEGRKEGETEGRKKGW